MCSAAISGTISSGGGGAKSYCSVVGGTMSFIIRSTESSGKAENYISLDSATQTIKNDLGGSYYLDELNTRQLE